MNSKRSLIDCEVVFVSLFLRCSLRQHTFAKPPQHKNIRNDYIDKKVRDALPISKFKTSTVFVAVVQKHVDF